MTGTTLFNTGVNGTGTPLVGGAADPHYTLVVNPSGAAPTPATVVTSPGGLGWSPGNGPNSDWISYDASGAAGAAATYTYQTTFDLSGFIASTASLSFIVENDNTIPDVRINGASTGITVGDSFSGFSGPFTISGGFVPGVNVLQFDVANGGGPTGFRMEVSSFTARPATAVAPVPLTAVEGKRARSPWPRSPTRPDRQGTHSPGRA